MIVFFPSSQTTKVDVMNGTRVALATHARTRAVHARKLLGWAPYGPDPCVGCESDARVPFVTSTLVVWLEGKKTILLLPTVA